MQWLLMILAVQNQSITKSQLDDSFAPDQISVSNREVLFKKV